MDLAMFLTKQSVVWIRLQDRRSCVVFGGAIGLGDDRAIGLVVDRQLLATEVLQREASHLVDKASSRLESCGKFRRGDAHVGMLRWVRIDHAIRLFLPLDAGAPRVFARNCVFRLPSLPAWK